jgi:hypothetical protein
MTVAIYDQNFNQLFPLAYVIQANVTEASKSMEHPLETGASIIDHRIILPIEIDLSLILNPIAYQNTYQQIKQLYLSGELLTVQTRADTYSNQIIVSMPHEENTEQFNTIIIALKLRQALFVTAVTQTLQPKEPTVEPTVSRGQVQSTPATPAQTTQTSKTVIDNLPQLPPPRVKGQSL